MPSLPLIYTYCAWLFKLVVSSFVLFTFAGGNCRALITMFKLTCGDPWVDELPGTNEDGSTNYAIASFIMSYIVIAVWTVLQVSETHLQSEWTVI